MDAEVAEAFFAKFGRKVHSFYGSTETGGITFDRSGEAARTGRSVGAPLPGVRLRFGRGGRFDPEVSEDNRRNSQAEHRTEAGGQPSAGRGRLHLPRSAARQKQRRLARGAPLRLAAVDRGGQGNLRHRRSPKRPEQCTTSSGNYFRDQQKPQKLQNRQGIQLGNQKTNQPYQRAVVPGKGLAGS